jgi:outer membrane protein OmpA-like peptidoglycan-associated protein
MQPMPSEGTISGTSSAVRIQARCALGAVLMLAGCSSAPGSDPIAWWRQLEGGRLAEERPLPPNADAPYPNLSSVPARPTATEASARSRIAAGIEADRRDGAFAASQPLVQPVMRPAPPPAPVPAGGIGASLAAAEAPAPATPAAAAAAAAAARPAPAAPAPAAAAAPTLAEAAIALPAGPPAAPRLPGVAAVTAPAPPRRAPPPVVAAPAAVVPGAPVSVVFQPGSAVLPEGSEAALRGLAATRAARDMVVTGFGEAAGEDAASQAAALPLAFARARALATALVQAGVPPGATRVTGLSTGAGGMVRIAE